MALSDVRIPHKQSPYNAFSFHGTIFLYYPEDENDLVDLMSILSGRQWTSTFIDFISNAITHEVLHMVVDEWGYDDGVKSGIDYWTDRGFLP